MMSLNTWIRTVRSYQRNPHGRFLHLRASRRPIPSVRLQVEWLEARTLLKPGPVILGLPLPLPLPPPITLPPVLTNPLPVLPNQNPLSILQNPLSGLSNPLSVLPNPPAVVPTPSPVVPSLPPVLSNPAVPHLPLVLSGPSSASSATNYNAAAGTPGNSPIYTGFSSSNRSSSFAVSGQGSPPVGGFFEGEFSSSKHSEDATFLSGLGDDDRMTVLDFPVELNLTSDDEVFSASDIAAALLIGVRPRLLPQKGSQVAPVATLLTEDSADEIKPANASDEEMPLKDFLINPLGAFSLDTAASLQTSLPSERGKGLAAVSLAEAVPSPKNPWARSSLAILTSTLVAFWGIQEFRSRRAKQATRNP